MTGSNWQFYLLGQVAQHFGETKKHLRSTPIVFEPYQDLSRPEHRLDRNWWLRYNTVSPHEFFTGVAVQILDLLIVEHC